jgi:hypothetical protein
MFVSFWLLIPYSPHIIMMAPYPIICFQTFICLQALKHIQDQGALDAYDSAMDAIHERLQGKGDDS